MGLIPTSEMGWGTRHCTWVRTWKAAKTPFSAAQTGSFHGEPGVLQAPSRMSYRWGEPEPHGTLPQSVPCTSPSITSWLYPEQSSFGNLNCLSSSTARGYEDVVPTLWLTHTTAHDVAGSSASVSPAVQGGSWTRLLCPRTCCIPPLAALVMPSQGS